MSPHFSMVPPSGGISEVALRVAVDEDGEDSSKVTLKDVDLES